MASKISLDPGILREQSSAMTKLKDDYEDLFSNITKTLNETNCNWSDVLSRNFSGKITSAQKSFSSIVTLLNNGAMAAANSAKTFQSVDSQLAKSISGYANISKNGSNVVPGSGGKKGSKKSSKQDEKLWDRFKNNLKYDFGICDIAKILLFGSSVYSIINGKNTPKKVAEFFKDTFKLGKTVTGIFKEYKDSKGSYVGVKGAVAHWSKKLLDLEKPEWATYANELKKQWKDGKITKSASIVGGFKSGLKNKISDDLSNLKTVKGGAGAVAGFALSGAVNFFDNKEEQKKSNGKMSDGRVWAETVTETVVGSAFSYLGATVVGAAVVALSPVALPGIAVTAISGVVIAGVGAGIKATTGASLTEHVSDFIIDTAEAKIKKAGTAKQVIGTAIQALGKAKKSLA